MHCLGDAIRSISGSSSRLVRVLVVLAWVWRARSNWRQKNLLATHHCNATLGVAAGSGSLQM